MGCAVISRICSFLAAALASLWVLTAQAQVASEFYDATLNRYFLGSDLGEMEWILGGGAGRSWVSTAYQFIVSCQPSDSDCKMRPVCRFYGAPPLGSGSHFFTADAGECEFVKTNPAWRYEGIVFQAAVPDATGQCPQRMLPIHRFYNGATDPSQARHRWTGDWLAANLMASKGWRDEGIVFCATDVFHGPLQRYDLRPNHIATSADCAANLDNTRSCIGTNNLPAPQIVQGVTNGDLIFENSGSVFNTLYSVSGPALAEAAADTFVNIYRFGFTPDTVLFADYLFGIHVSTKSKGPANLSSVNPLYQFELSPPADGAPERRFTPFAGQYDSDVDIVLSFNLLLKKLRTTAGSSAYGHTTLDFWDRASNLHLYFIVLAYGTVPTVDNIIRDGPAGNPIVVTAFRDSPYGRNYAARVMDTPAPFDWPGRGAGGYFEFHVNTVEFQRIVAAARTIEPRLSTNLADYAVDDFHFNSEIAGDGEIGENFSYISVYLVPTGQRPF